MKNFPNLNLSQHIPPLQYFSIAFVVLIAIFSVLVIQSNKLITRMAGTSALENLKEVDIDPEGVFKYILIKVYGPEKGGVEPAKTIVRGYKRCPYHSKL